MLKMENGAKIVTLKRLERQKVWKDYHEKQKGELKVSHNKMNIGSV